MKIFKILFFLFIITRAWGDTGRYLWGGNILDELNNGISILETELTFTHIVNLNREDLRILRNAVYARHGYQFRSVDLSNYFIKFSWYKAEYSNVDNKLTETDMNNIRLIQSVENNYPARNYELVGLWWDPPRNRQFAVDAAGPDQLRIYPNGIYVIVWTHRADNYIFNSGLWSYGNNILRFNGNIVNINEGGNVYVNDEMIIDIISFENELFWKYSNNANSAM